MPAYLIMKIVPHNRISDYAEEVGIVVTNDDDWQDVDRVIDKLNAEDDEGRFSPYGRPNYFRKELPLLNIQNCLEEVVR